MPMKLFQCYTIMDVVLMHLLSEHLNLFAKMLIKLLWLNQPEITFVLSQN